MAGWLPLLASPLGWNDLKIGNGGITTHFDSASDGTQVVSTDSFGGYIWDATANKWQQIMTYDRMPAGVDSAGFPIGSGFDTIVIDQNNSNNIWLQWKGNVYKSTNKCATVSYAGNWPNQYTHGWQSQDANPSKAWGPTLAVDPINSSVVYASTPNKGLYLTTDGGLTWTLQTTFAAGLPVNAGTAASYPKIGTDATSLNPASFVAGNTVTFSNNSSNFGFTVNGTDAQSNVVQVWSASDPTKQFVGYVSTASSGTTFTLTIIAVFGSGAKTDWNVSYANNSAPSGDTISGGHRICFDESGGTSGGRTKNIYVHTYGVNTWFSNNAGSSWSSVSATNKPATIGNAVCDRLGVLWVVTDDYPTLTSNIWKYSASTWANIDLSSSGGGGLTASYTGVAIDYANSASVTTVAFSATSSGFLAVSNDGGGTWTGQGRSAPNVNINSAPADVVWVEGYYGAVSAFNVATGASLKFDRTGNGVLYHCVEGVWYGVPSYAGGGSNVMQYTQKSRGIEEFIGIRCVSPQTGKVVITTWDFPGFYTDTFGSYPTASQIIQPGVTLPNGLELGHDVDYLWSNPNHMVAIVGDNANTASNTYDCYSNDGGVTWTVMSSLQTIGGGGGFIAVAANNTWVKCFSSHNGVTQPPKETTNGGVSWSTPAFFSAYPNADWGNIAFYATTCRFMDSDKANGNIYLYCVNDQITGDQIFKRTAAGTWSKTAVGSLGIGVIANFNGVLKSSGTADTIFLTPGLQASHPGNVPWYFTTDGWASVSRTVTGFKEVQAYGFGAKFPGSAFQTVFAYGWYTGTAIINGASVSVTDSYGLWMCKNFDTSTGNGTWRLCANPGSTNPYPKGILSNITDVDGDKTVAGRVYVMTNGGAFYGNFS